MKYLVFLYVLAANVFAADSLNDLPADLVELPANLQMGCG